MIAKEFTVKSDPIGSGFRAWFRLYVYDTVDELNRAAKRFRPEEAKWIDCIGVFQPNLSFGVDKRGRFTEIGMTKYLGVMRLTTEVCNEGIVIHECTHAAVNYVNALNLRVGYKIGDSNLDYEEALCHAVQEFSCAVLYAMGYHENQVQRP